jgi:hypothetical protein
MTVRAFCRRPFAITIGLGIATGLVACGSKEPPAPASPPTEAAAPTAAAPVAATQPAGAATWTPEALEELLAPIALYPDPVLSQVLIASTNPQEVLDAGNWLIANESLRGEALDEAAAKVGFTPPIRALVQFPQTVDLMCMEMGWTTELGQAFVADQAGVLDAVQRLRKQAIDVGNLQTSKAMVVETTEQEGKDVVVLKPAQPEVVYVPTYDPQAAYAPPAAAPATTTAAAPAATTTTVVTEDDDDGHSTGTLVATGVLAFGAGILVSELLEDDDDYYYPNYGHGGMPYYPPYPYRPAYGGGYYPSNGYNRPPNYNSGWQNSGTIIINNPGGSGTGGGYWDRYDNRAGASNTAARQARATNSPITAAKPNRPELQQLNQRQPRPMPANVQPPSPTTNAANWKGQSSYAGKDTRPAGASRDPATRIAEAQPGYSRPASSAGAKQRPAPKVQGSYAGKERARSSDVGATPGTREVQTPRPGSERPNAPSTREVRPPPVGAGDRGYAAQDLSRPEPSTRDIQQRPADGPAAGTSAHRATAVSGANRGGADRAASQRGRQSMPQGARSKGGGGRDRGR